MKRNYDNALTSMGDMEVQKTINKLMEDVNKLQSLQKNKMLSESDRIPLEEGLWDNVKYGLSKLGRYKAAGKIFGKGKVDKEWKLKVKKLLDKKGNELIKNLDRGIDEINSTDKGEFPNNKEQKTFLDIVLLIAGVYDTIKEATKKDIKEEGYLPIDAANSLILDLRTYVQKFLDVDLAGIYSVMDSEDKDGEVISEKKVWKGKTSGKTKPDYEPSAGDVRDTFKKGSSDGDEKIDSTRMGKDGLGSNTLVTVLLAVGSALGAFGWLTHTAWWKDLFTYEGTEESLEVIKGKTEIFDSIKGEEGFTQMFNRLNNAGLDMSSSPEDFLAQVKELGGGDLQAGITELTKEGGAAMDPEKARMVFNEIAKNPHGHGDNLGEIFKGDWAGTGENAGDMLRTVPGGGIKKIIISAAIKVVTKTVLKTAGGFLFTKILGALAGPIGLAAIAGGLLVKGFREKGKKWSRAKTLDMLLQSLQTVKGDGKQVPVIIDPNKEDTKGDGEDPNKEDEPAEDKTNPIGDEEGDVSIGKDITSQNFLRMKRNAQLSYLSKKFLPKGGDYWSVMGIKPSNINSSFLDLLTGSAKYSNGDQEIQQWEKRFNKMKEGNEFTKNYTKWQELKAVADKNKPLLIWIRNTRKGIGSFIKSINKTFPELNLSGREVLKKGEAMKTSNKLGDSVLPKPLMNEEVLNNATKTNFSEKLFMKNLPEFIEMISLIYKSEKGVKLVYDSSVVYGYCKKFGCKGSDGDSGNGKTTPTMGQNMADKGKVQDQISNRKLMSEEIKRIKNIMDS